MDIGVNGLDQAELQMVFACISRSSSDSVGALVSAVADAISDPPGFMTRIVARLDQIISAGGSKPDPKNCIDDARFRQLLEYINQVIQSRGDTATRHFEAADLNRDGLLTSTEFIKGLVDIGVNGVDTAELQRVFQRLEGSGLDSAQALVASVADALADPMGFISRTAISQQPFTSTMTLPKPRRVTVQLRTSVLRKLGFGAVRCDDGRALSITRIDSIGLLADWNAGQLQSERIQVGDKIIEVNGTTASADDMSRALQSAGLITIIVQCSDRGGGMEADQIMDATRFKQLLEYFGQVFLSCGRTAARYFESIDFDRDGRLSCAEFVKGLTDLGVNGVEHSELQKVFQRIQG